MNKIVKVGLGIVIQPRKGAEGGDMAGGYELLITRRPRQTVYGGYWELPGGKIEKNETPAAAVQREILEEVGLNVLPTLPLTPVIHIYPHAHVALHPFFCLRHEGICRNLAVEEHRWVLPGEVWGYQFPEANTTILQEMIRRWDEATACKAP